MSLFNGHGTPIGRCQSTEAGSGQPKLRVAVLSRVFSTTGGGAERYSIALVEALATHHDIHVFAQTIEHHCVGVTYHLISTPLRRPRWVNQLWFATATWWATRHLFDVVHSHENTWHGNVQTVHVLPVKHNLFKQRDGLRRWIRWAKVLTSPRLVTYLVLEKLRFAPREGRQVVVTSDALRKVMLDTYPASGSMLSVVTPGISLPSLPAGALKQPIRLAAKSRLGLPSSAPCLLFMANDFRKKGLGVVLQALASLPAATVLAVVGNPDQQPDFSAAVHVLGLRDRVFFMGRMRDVADAYLAADCLVHPTLEDTFAMVVLEAMAYGLPCVVSGPAFCGISSLLQHGRNALLLNDPHDAKALGIYLQTLMADADLQRGLSAEALAFAAQYEWSDIAAQQGSIYQLTQHPP